MKQETSKSGKRLKTTARASLAVALALVVLVPLNVSANHVQEWTGTANCDTLGLDVGDIGCTFTLYHTTTTTLCDSVRCLVSHDCFVSVSGVLASAVANCNGEPFGSSCLAGSNCGEWASGQSVFVLVGSCVAFSVSGQGNAAVIFQTPVLLHTITVCPP